MPPNHYYAVMDFECTCWEREDPDRREHEIIEFPVVFLNSKTLEIDFEFHEYVRPTEYPILSPFCVELTGISQSTVDESDDLETVLERFKDFLVEKSIESFTACTDGPWDFTKFLYPETKRKRLVAPSWSFHWVNVRKQFQYIFQLPRWIGVEESLEKLGLSFEGRPHSGIDDARNIARIVKAIHVKKGKRRIKPNSSLHYTHFLAITPYR
jgi:3'-5' exoribonuclease 1